MKKVFLLILGLFFGLSYAQLTPTENYVYSKVYLGYDTNNQPTKTAEAVTYFDGLGRPKQSVAIKASPKGNDIVSHIEYDGFGRQVLDYLPVPQSGTLNGGLVPTPLANATNIYPVGEIIYSEKILENSPLDRIQQQYGTGESWRANSKKTEFFYETNSSTDAVINFSTTTTPVPWTNSATFSNLLKGSNYVDAMLYKNTVKDEDNNETIEFKNGEGQTLLVRKNDGVNKVDTYYVYNEYNQLAFVVSPEATKAIKSSANPTTFYTQTDPILNDLCYQYRYDGRGRLVEKKLPGKGWEYMLYDKQDRLIATQDANLRLSTNNFGAIGWLFTKYDMFGRVVYTGFTANSSDRNTLQSTSIDNNTSNPQNNESKLPSNNPAPAYSGLILYYTNIAFPTTITELLSANYYDTYPTGTLFPASNEILGTPILLDDGTADRSTKSLPTASFVKNIENNGWTKNYTFYDRKARPIGSNSFNHLSGYTRTETELDFAGVPQKTFTYHKRLSTDATEIQIKERFEYNQYTNALVKHFHNVNNQAEDELLVENTYNEIGQLTNKKVGNNIQEIGYSYNIRGWMAGINDGDILSNPSEESYTLTNGKLFGYKIKYNNPENPSLAPARYNGNIAEVDWIDNISSLKRYGYEYDKLNRLLKGNYQDPGASVPETHINDEILTYDLNGNIATLVRKSKDGKTYTPIIVDNLTYTYENGNNSNRLKNITDATNNVSGYPGGGKTITYDSNGNMTAMPDKGISAIAYNFLNLPTQIDQNTNTTTYLYRADGVKLKKIYNLVNAAGSKIINTEYLDGFQYSTPNIDPIRKAIEEIDDSTISAKTAGNEEAFSPLEERLVIIGPGVPQADNMILSFFPTAEGYYDYENFRYIYQYKDHLGNVRVSYVKNANNTLKVMDTNDYYPFGMSFIKGVAFGGSVYDPMAIPYNYKYNGKELQETGMYDYGARMYMPDIGRWGVIDPRSQYTHEAYSYVWNNPIFFNDPTGMTGEGTQGVSDWIYNPNTNRYKWDPNVTGEGNTPKDWEYVGKTGSYRVDGGTVQLLDGGKTFIDIDEVAVSRASPAAAAIVFSRNFKGGLFSFLAVAAWYIASDFVSSIQTYQPIRIDPTMYRHTDNAKADDTDVNGVKVPDQDNRTSNDPLRQKKNGEPLEDSEAAGTRHTQLGKKEGRKGKYRQGREFENGEAEWDYDITDHGRPANHPNPHKHKWEPNSTGGTKTRVKKPWPIR